MTNAHNCHVAEKGQPDARHVRWASRTKGKDKRDWLRDREALVTDSEGLHQDSDALEVNGTAQQCKSSQESGPREMSPIDETRRDKGKRNIVRERLKILRHAGQDVVRVSEACHIAC